MLLRIIDIPADKDAVRVVLENEGQSDTYTIAAYTSPVTANFLKLLACYFNDYPQYIGGDIDGSAFMDKLIRMGKYIGDELLGEGFQLINLKEDIEKQGYENLEVRIESPRIGFFDELWEAVILPESNYVLSAVVKGYVRQIIHEDAEQNLPHLRYQLKANVSAPHGLGNLLHSEGGSADVPHRPLHVFYLVSRPEKVNLPFSSSVGTSLNMNAVAAVDYELSQTLAWEQLQAALSNENRPVHILHYDGPIILENNVPHIALADGLTDIEKLSRQLLDSGVAVLSIDARAYLEDMQSVSAAMGLAMVAQSAHKSGLGNVIGLGQISNPWTSGQCFEAVYSQITRGCTLGQAVVEARKHLQSYTETSLMTVEPISFHTWPLLVHYSKQTVSFFDPPKAPGDPAASGETALFQDRLFGFQTEMLPPLLEQVCDAQALSLISELSPAGRSRADQAAAIVGEPGSGRTQLAHVVSLYFAQKEQLDYGFYFDLADHSYSSSDILEMIAPVLGVNGDQKDRVKDQLAQRHCCFVFDNVSSHEEPSSEGFSERRESLSQFIKTLISQNHKIIVIGDADSSLHETAPIRVRTVPLLPVEQKVLAANCMRRFQITGADQNGEWDKLLLSLNGHPWLTKKMMPLLKSFSAAELTAQVGQHIVNQQTGSKVSRFYRWQWASLRPVWQRLLITCSRIPGLLLEMLMIAADQREDFKPARAFSVLLGDEDARFSEGLNLLELSGFIKRFPHGRLIDSRCLSFLEDQRTTGCLDGIDQQKLQLHFSQTVCEGIRILSQHIAKQPNPSVLNNLLLNRRHWAECFETLWFNQDYTGFMRVRNAFEPLLQQANLTGESSLWALDLLGRSSVPATCTDTKIEEKLAWFSLASSVLDQDGASNSSGVLEAVETWRIWFDSFAGSGDRVELALFQRVTAFLEHYYRSQSDWKACINICEKAYRIYTQHDAWMMVTQSLKSLARYYYELGEKEQALIIENKIIHDIPYAESPPGFKTRQLLDVLFARLSRTDSQGAQHILDQLRASEEAENMATVLDNVQSEIHYQEGDFLSALPYFCSVWVNAIQSNQQAHVEQLKPRLIEIEQKIGRGYFDEVFAREVPEGVIKPRDYVSSLH